MHDDRVESVRDSLIGLCGEHETLRVLMRDYNALMTSAHRPDRDCLAALIRARLHFCQTLRAHIFAEESLVCSALAQQGAGNGAALALGFPVGMRDLLSRYSAHLSRWSANRIQPGWDEYRQAVADLQTLLHARMAWEEREVYVRLHQMR